MNSISERYRIKVMPSAARRRQLYTLVPIISNVDTQFSTSFLKPQSSGIHQSRFSIGLVSDTPHTGLLVVSVLGVLDEIIISLMYHSSKYVQFSQQSHCSSSLLGQFQAQFSLRLVSEI